MDRKDNYELDLGVVCMYKHWTEPADMRFAMAITERLTEGFNKALAGIPKYKDYKAICNNDPILHGNWGGELRTMTEQAAEMRIPTIQLEIPLKMRAHLFGNEAFSKAFLAVITDTYKEVITPMWEKKQEPVRCNPELALGLKTTKGPKEDEELLKTYTEWEKKMTTTTEKVI